MPFLTKALKKDVTPPKYLKLAALAVFVALPVLYTSAAFLYFLLLCLSKGYIDQRFSQAISIIEIAVTVLSIIISVIATKISDHFTNTCIERIEHIKRQNSPLFNNHALITQDELTKRYIRITQKARHFILIPFSIYLAIMVVYYFFAQSTVIQMLTVISGSVSAIFSIILAWVSSASCVVTGKYTNLLLDALYKQNQEIFDLYNKLQIDKSHAEDRNS